MPKWKNKLSFLRNLQSFACFKQTSCLLNSSGQTPFAKKDDHPENRLGLITASSPWTIGRCIQYVHIPWPFLLSCFKPDTHLTRIILFKISFSSWLGIISCDFLLNMILFFFLNLMWYMIGVVFMCLLMFFLCSLVFYFVRYWINCFFFQRVS